MNRSFKIIILSLVLSLGVIFDSCLAQTSSTQGNRQASAAGSFYPTDKAELNDLLEDLFNKAEPVSYDGTIQSLIVPHAGYASSGKVAASAYKSIPKTASYKNVFVIATSHQEQFTGSSVYPGGNYITPLGEAVINSEIAAALMANNESINFHERVHSREHAIEVQLPFIQYRFGDVPIVPILMGSSSISGAHDLATALIPYFTPDNLFIISTNFSNYPSYSDAKRIDKLTGESILKKDPESFYNTLRKNSMESVPNLSTSTYGWSAIMTLLYMAQREIDLVVSPVLYQNSGDVTAGNKERVVGYWAIATHFLPEGELNYSLSSADKEKLLDIARKTLETFILTGELYQVSSKTLSPILKEPAGAFVSLSMGGRPRGSIGNYIPENPLYLVVQEMVLAAATHDERFAPVEKSDLEYIDIEISVLSPLQKISSLEEFQLGKHGIFMSRDGKSGSYLPQAAKNTGWDTEEFLGHCAREEAGIGWNGWKEADLYIFEAITFGNPR